MRDDSLLYKKAPFVAKRGDIDWGFAALLRWKSIIVSSVPDNLVIMITFGQKLLLQSCLLATQVYQL